MFLTLLILSAEYKNCFGDSPYELTS